MFYLPIIKGGLFTKSFTWHICYVYNAMFIINAFGVLFEHEDQCVR